MALSSTLSIITPPCSLSLCICISPFLHHTPVSSCSSLFKKQQGYLYVVFFFQVFDILVGSQKRTRRVQSKSSLFLPPEISKSVFSSTCILSHSLKFEDIYLFPKYFSVQFLKIKASPSTSTVSLSGSALQMESRLFLGRIHSHFLERNGKPRVHAVFVYPAFSLH